MMVKSFARPAAGPKRLSRRWAVAWNVPPCTFRLVAPTSFSTRAEHLLRGSPREREKQDSLGSDTPSR